MLLNFLFKCLNDILYQALHAAHLNIGTDEGKGVINHIENGLIENTEKIHEKKNLG